MGRFHQLRFAASGGMGRQTLIVLLGWWALAGPVLAGTGGVSQLPLGGATPKNGLQLIVDTRWVDTNGYRPVKITALTWPAVPAVVSRTIRVEFAPDFWRYGRPSAHRVTGYVEIPEGALRGETTLAVPQSGNPVQLGIAVYEDGVLLKDLSTDSLPVTQRVYTEPSEAVPAILIIDADVPSRDMRDQLVRNRNVAGVTTADTTAPRLPDLRQLPPSFAADGHDYSGSPVAATATPVTGPPDDVSTLDLLGTLPRIELLSPAELPQWWLAYTCFDMVFISAADLQTVVAQHPAAWQALRDWLATGPTLCVYDMQLSPEALRPLESLLELSAPAARDPAGATPASWRVPDPGRALSDSVTALTGLRSQYYPTNPQSTTEEAAAAPPPATPTPPEQTPFLVRDVNRGRVVAMSTSEPLVGGRYGFPWLLNELGAPTWMWYQRHGISLHRTNDDFWNWIVPGIGLTPVGSFLVLIALFVIVIGPVNYYLLRRWRRLYLLLVTVPAGAALVTVALFAYALICDGLGVRVRVRGLTEIDQRSGRMVSWSRQSFYAGLAPAQGLRYPTRTAVYAIEVNPMERGAGGRAARHVIWDGDQHLATGYISSRSTSELLVVDSGPREGGLRLVEGPADPPALEVTNQLPAQLDQLAVWDSAGRCFWCEGLAPGQAAAMTPLATNRASEALCLTLTQHQPSYPAGFDTQYYDRGWGYGRRYYGWGGMDGGLPPPEFSTGILERGLTGAVSLAGAVRPEPRSYVALTHASPGVPLGCPTAREEASIYVILGKW